MKWRCAYAKKSLRSQTHGPQCDPGGFLFMLIWSLWNALLKVVRLAVFFQIFSFLGGEFTSSKHQEGSGCKCQQLEADVARLLLLQKDVLLEIQSLRSQVSALERHGISQSFNVGGMEASKKRPWNSLRSCLETGCNPVAKKNLGSSWQSAGFFYAKQSFCEQRFGDNSQQKNITWHGWHCSFWSLRLGVWDAKSSKQLRKQWFSHHGSCDLIRSFGQSLSSLSVARLGSTKEGVRNVFFFFGSLTHYLFFLSPMLQVTGKHGCNEVILTRFSNIIFVIPINSQRLLHSIPLHKIFFREKNSHFPLGGVSSV